MKVIIGCWESDTAKDGQIDNLDEFWQMWAVVTTQYEKSAGVYFEIFNEPFGYSPEDWTDIAATFLQQFPTIPPARVIVSGHGYNENLLVVGADSRLQDCLLSLHIYAYWFPSYVTTEEWTREFRSRVGPYFPRAIVSEYGVPMTTGVDYTGAINNDSNVAFLYAIPDQIRAYQMGSVYWPGLRDYDTFSLQARMDDNLEDIRLTVTNPSGVTRIQVAYGL